MISIDGRNLEMKSIIDVSTKTKLLFSQMILPTGSLINGDHVDTSLGLVKALL